MEEDRRNRREDERMETSAQSVDVAVGRVPTSFLASPSSIPGVDYSINPYVGCPHKCLYCSAQHMPQFRSRSESWGDFVDVKLCSRRLPYKKLEGKTVILSSVTDPYNPLEAREKATRSILEDMIFSQCRFNLLILTKGCLVLRDTELFREMDASVGLSINCLDEEFQGKIEPRASSVSQRLEALRRLHEAGVRTWVFVAPVFPAVTDVGAILEAVAPWASYVFFESLKLRPPYKEPVLALMERQYPTLRRLYRAVYRYGERQYWRDLTLAIHERCSAMEVPYRIFF